MVTWRGVITPFEIGNTLIVVKTALRSGANGGLERVVVAVVQRNEEEEVIPLTL